MAQTEDWSQFPEAPAEDWSQFPEADAAPAPKAAQPGLVDRGLAVMKNVGAAMLDPMGKNQPSQSDRIVAGANEISATQPGRARIEELGAPVRPEVARKVRETPQATEPWQQNVQAAGRADAKRRRENAPAVANLPADSLQQANAVPSLPSDEYQPSGTITGLQETLADGLARRAVESTGSDAMGTIVRDSVDLVGTLAKIAPTTGKMIFDTAQLAPVIGQIAEWGSDAMAEVISDISRGQSADIQAKASRLAQLARDGNGAQVAEYILAHPDLLADVAIPSAASMYVIGGVGRLTGNQVAASLPTTVSARARERIRQRAAEQGAMWANVAANAGSAFAETDGPVGAKYLAALIAGAGTRSVAKITGGGAEGAIARGPGAVAANPVAQVAGIAGREAGQEFVEGASESIGSQTGEYVAGTRDDVSLRQAINQGTIEALAAGPTGAAAGVTVAAEAMQNDPHRIGLRAADAIARSIENGQWDQASIDAQVRASMDPNPGGVDGAAGLDAGRDSGRGAVAAGGDVLDAAGAENSAQQGAGAPAVVATGSEAGAPVAATGGEPVPALTTGDPLQDAVLALEAEAFQGQAPEVAAAAQAAMPKPAAPAEPSAEQKAVADSLNSVLPAEEKLDAGSVRIFTPAELPDNEAGATAGAVVSRGTAELLTGIGEALGRRVAFYDYPGADGHADGFWSSRTSDTVFLRPAVGSASVERVFGHEIQHSLEESEKQVLLDAFMAATADGQAVVDMSDEAMLGFLTDYSGGRLVQKIEQLRGQGMPAAEVLDTLLKERNTSREALRDEFVSDIMGNRMAEPETWKKVFRNVAKQDTGVLRKIYRTLTDVINYLTNRGQSAQFREVEKHIRDLRAVRKAVAQVLASRMVKQQEAAPAAKDAVVLSAKRIGPFNSRVSAESSARYQPFDSNIVTGSDGKFYVEAINGTERAADRADDTRGASRVQPAAVADRRDPGAAPARGERPSYGTARENAVRVVGVHYSKGDRTTLNGAYYGTGMKGAEAERLRGADPELLSRVYFYVDTGNGITPESDVGPRAHDVELTNLYDAFADPLRLNADAADTNAFELAVIRAGFDGYLIRQFGNQGAAVLVGRQHKAVPVRRTGDGFQKAEAAPAPKLSPERELAQRLTSNRRFPAGQLPPARWADVIFGLDPEAHDTLAEAGLFEGDTPVYLSELAGRYVRQAAQPRLSAPRADRNNTVSAVVGARPGEYNWSPAAKVSAALADRDTKVANLEADVAPPPFAAPIQQSPNLERIGDAVRSILGSKGARTLIQDLTGVSGIKVAPIFGSWQGKGEPSFVLTGEGMTFESAGDIGQLLGFAFAQDAVVATQPWFEETDDQIPFLRISQARALSEDQARRLFEAARAEGLDYSTTVDGRGATFLHFGDEADGAALKEKVGRIAQAAGLSKVEKGFARSTLHEAETYLTGRVGEGLRGDSVDPEGRPDLFRRTVDHLLVPYAKAVGAEGYRFSPDRFGERFGLTADQVEYIRAALRPKKGLALSTVGILTGAEPLEVAKRDFRKKTPGTLKEDLMWALQNRAAQIGFIEPSDRSPEARRAIAEALADEVVYALGQEGGKSAVGWYDAALKRAKETYEQVFPELRSDADREMLFDAVLGITSQGNDVHSNAVFAGRVYHLVTREGMSISQAVDTLYGTFGKQTRAIELNLLKLEHLINTNGAAEVRRFFNQKSTVSELNAKLRNSPNLYDQNGAPLAADGQADQVVTGWMVFGPKIGSFINNLHGDYSTLTADLWFSRTWNRMTGFLFRYTPEKATAQYATAARAAIAEAETGEGKDLTGWTADEVRALVEDPDQFIPFLEKVHATREADYKAGQALKLKDDALKAYAITTLRQAAKNLIETRGETVALPRNDTERLMQQLTVEEAQRIVKRKTGVAITVADIQAVLWYHEKNLFSKYGVGDKKTEAADYADAAARFVERFQNGDLFYVEKPEKRYVVGERGSYLKEPDVRLSAPRLSAEERAVEQRFQDLIDQNPDRMVAAYLEDNGPVLDTDKARPLSPDYLENPSRWSAAVHEPASDLVKRIYARLLAEAPQGSTVLFTGGGGGSGKGYVLETLPELLDGAEVVYDMTMASYGSTRSKIDQALAAGMRVRIAFVYRPPRLALQGVLERGVATGRVVPIAPLADAHANAPRTLQRLQEEFANDDRVTIEVVRNVGKTPRRAPLSGIAMRESADLLEEFTNEVERYFAEGRIDAVARDAYLGRSETDSGSGAGVSEGASGDERAGLRDDGRTGRAAPGGEASEGVALSPRRADMRSVAAIAKMAPALLSSPQITTNDQRFADMATAAMAGVVRREGAPSENVPAVNIPMAPMPAVLQMSGVSNQILTIHAQVLDKVMNWKHGDDVMGLTYQEIANLFRTPALVVKAPNGDIEMIFDRQGANGPLIGVVQPDVVTDGVRHAVVKSIYSRPLKDVDARLRAAFDPEKTTAKYVDLSRLRGVYEVRSFTAGGIGTGYPGALKIAREGSASRRVKEWADLVKFVGDKYRGPVADTPQFSTPRAPVAASFVAPDPTRWDGFIYKMQDRFVDLKRVQASIAEAGRQIQDQFDAYLAEELYHGRAAHRVQAFMQTELEPLLKKLKANQIEIEAFERYLHARHAKERNAAMKRANPTRQELDALILQAEANLASLQQQRAGATGNTFVLDGLIRSAEAKLRALRVAKPWSGTAADREMLSGMSDADAAQILKSAPKVMAVLAKYVDQITAGTRDELRHYGLETDEVLDDMEKAYQFYVPLRRDMEESDLLGDMSMGTGQGFSVRGSKIKRATGSLRPVENILANIAAAREQAIVRGEKNRVTLALYGMALQHPNPEFWVAIRPSAVSNKAMRAELQGLGLPASVLQVMEDAPTEPHINERTGLVEHRVNPLLAQQPTVIALRVKGQDRLLVLSRDDDRAVRMAMALKNQDTQVDPASPLGAALRGLGITTRYLSSINTQYNPIFGLKNFIRDVQGAALNLTTTPIAGKEAALLSHVPTAMRAVWVSERGGTPNATWGALYQDFLAQGAQTGYRDMYAGMDDRAQALQRVIEPAWWQKAKPLNAVLDALSDYNTAIENAVRLSAYKVALDAGLSKPRAASVAKNLTVNFNRKGQVGREASAMYAFFNASVQGTARIWETLKGPKGKAIIAGGIGLGVMQALLGYAIMGDDWDDIPEYIRSRNLIIPLGGDAGEDTGRAGSRYVMIPMPLGFNALPSVGRIFTEMAIFQDKLGARALTAVTSVLDATNPLGSENPVEMALPSVLDPIYQLGANKNSFGQPIAREDMNSLDPTPGEVRFTRNATTFGKLVATGINRATGGDEWTPGLASPTPDQIDFVFGQVTGGVGRESMKVYQSLESLVTGDPVPASRVPIIGMFYGKTNSDQGIRAKYYAAVQDINLAERKLNGLAGSGGNVSGHLAERPQAALYKTADKIGRKISGLNRYRATLTAADRAKKKQIDQEVMALQSLLIDLHEQAKAQGQ